MTLILLLCTLITLIYHKKCSGEASARVIVIVSYLQDLSIPLSLRSLAARHDNYLWRKKHVLIMMTFSKSLAVLKMFWKKSWLIIFVIDSLIHVFAWKQYPDRGAECQSIVHRRVLWITPPKPTLHFKMIVEVTRLIVFLSQVQFLHDKLLIFSIKFYITMFWKPSKYVLWFISI